MEGSCQPRQKRNTEKAYMGPSQNSNLKNYPPRRAPKIHSFEASISIKKTLISSIWDGNVIGVIWKLWVTLCNNRALNKKVKGFLVLQFSNIFVNEPLSPKCGMKPSKWTSVTEMWDETFEINLCHRNVGRNLRNEPLSEMNLYHERTVESFRIGSSMWKPIYWRRFRPPKVWHASISSHAFAGRTDTNRAFKTVNFRCSP